MYTKLFASTTNELRKKIIFKTEIDEKGTEMSKLTPITQRTFSCLFSVCCDVSTDLLCMFAFATPQESRLYYAKRYGFVDRA